jgi:hypothetical protein
MSKLIEKLARKHARRIIHHSGMIYQSQVEAILLEFWKECKAILPVNRKIQLPDFCVPGTG